MKMDKQQINIGEWPVKKLEQQLDFETDVRTEIDRVFEVIDSIVKKEIDMIFNELVDFSDANYQHLESIQKEIIIRKTLRYYQIHKEMEL